MRIPDSWEILGETSNVRYFRDGPFIVSVPDDGVVDDESSAIENRAWQESEARRSGPLRLIVFVDRMTSQDRTARKLYAEMGPDSLRAVALVGGNLLSRAMASFFLGLANPKVPFRLVTNYDEACRWLSKMEVVDE